MKSIYKLCMIFLCMCIMLGACKGKTETVQNEPEPLDYTGIVSFSAFANIEFAKKADAPAAHKKYLSEALQFTALPDYGITEEQTAVVGSDVCLFYPEAEINTEEDLANLPEGIPLPIGTLIAIEGEPIRREPSTDWDLGALDFQDNQNFFYRTTWDGKKGLVFGADLNGLGNGFELNKAISQLYKTAGVPDKFYPAAGENILSQEIQEQLQKNKLVFQRVSPREYYLSAQNPDDMIALYTNHAAHFAEHSYRPSDKAALFITTDLMAHSKHLLFDRLLQNIEENFFMPRLHSLTETFIEKLDKVNTQDFPTANTETVEKAKLYFQTAKALIELAGKPAKEEDEWGREEIVYKDPDKEAVLSKYPQAVKDEIDLMDAAQGMDTSPIFTFADGSSTKEDYSQYKPRGHYTKNSALSAYFRAMMWFGRIHFLIADKGPEVLSSGGSTASGSEDLTLNMEPVALLITDLVKNDQSLYEAWARLFDPITDLIGLSDDLSFKEVLPLWKSYKVKDFKKWSSDKKNLIAFMKSAHEKLTPPAIAGNSVFYTASEGSGAVSADGSSVDRKPPMGWRLFGQRFTFDSAVHNSVSSPRLYGREMIQGLDIMKAFGSNAADVLLKNEYAAFPNLKPILEKTEQKVKTEPESVFGKTYYGSVLNEIALQAQFEQGSGFYFTESPAWNIKALLTAHGTWAELRHDTILYVKQNYAEMGGEPEDQLTFRTKPIPSQVHYIEPNLAFWNNTVSSIDCLIKALEPYNLIDEQSLAKLNSLKKLAAKACEIVQREINDEEVSEDDIKWIAGIPLELAHIVSPNINGDISADQLRMALVADVFTNGEKGVVLETAIGIPYRIYVPLNDKQGGKRIAVGYCFNYYEFEQPISERLTNEEWKERAYNMLPEYLEELKPEWARTISIAEMQSGQ